MNQLAIIPATDQTTLESQLTRWKEAEEGFERCTLLSRVMQGLCLSELRKLHGTANRGNPALRNSPKRSENWADYVKSRWGFSDDKARILIQMADAARPRLRKLAEQAQAGLGSILDKPIAQLSDVETATLKQVTHKLTDGKTQYELQQELGLFKEPAMRGGKREKAGPEETPEEKEARVLGELRDLFALRIAGIEHATEDASWRLVEDVQIEHAIDVLEAFISGAREWLKTPKSKRAAIAVGRGE